VLKKDEILNAQDLKTEVVHVPQWGGDVIVRELTTAQRNEVYKYIADNRESAVGRFQPMVVRMSVVGEDGHPVFSEDDEAALAGKSSKAMDIVFAACCRTTKLRRADIAETAKNSEETPTDGSSSD